MKKIDAYKLLYERAEKYSERRQTTSQTYLTINTVIFGTIAFLVKDLGLKGGELTIAISPLFIVGVLVCIIWLNIIINLEKILSWQYQQLREFEEKLEDDIDIFTKENNQFFNPKKGKRFSFSMLEAWIPRILIAVYLIYYVGMIVLVMSGIM